MAVLVDAVYWLALDGPPVAIIVGGGGGRGGGGDGGGEVVAERRGEVLDRVDRALGVGHAAVAGISIRQRRALPGVAARRSGRRGWSSSATRRGGWGRRRSGRGSRGR